MQGLDLLKAEYAKADKEGKEWLKIVTKEKDNTLNAIATVKMNSFIQIKAYLIEKAGTIALDSQEITKRDAPM